MTTARKIVKVTYVGEEARVFPGQGLIRPGDEVEVFDDELDSPLYQKSPAKKPATKPEPADAGEPDGGQ